MRAALQSVVPSISPARDVMLHEVMSGLRQKPKRLPSQYLYDARGAALFERICSLDEYYLTRTEMSILREALPEIAWRIGMRGLVFEPGSGASEKTLMLLAALYEPAAYVPVDVSSEQLFANANRLAREFPKIEIAPVCADFSQPLRLPVISRRVDRRVCFFPGSTLGNFAPEQAVDLLRKLKGYARDGGAVLVGIDLQKAACVLEPAYNDTAGVSADFALNYLVRLNRELDADFDLDCFGYEAPYNRALGRIEMYLVSRLTQVAHVGGHEVRLAAGERICTELSYKYSLAGFRELTARAGLRAERVWTDPQRYFSVQLLTASCRE
jgi:dimethylhistidine N-methyltransferase